MPAVRESPWVLMPAISESLNAMSVYLLSITALYQLIQVVNVYDRISLNIIHHWLSPMAPEFFHRMHTRAAARRAARGKDDLVCSFAGLTIALRALAMIKPGQKMTRGVPRSELTTHMYMFLACSWRERFDATYACFFLPGATHLYVNYIRSNDERRRGYILRGYELFSRFYIRLLVEPWMLFINPVPKFMPFRRPRIPRARPNA